MRESCAKRPGGCAPEPRGPWGVRTQKRVYSLTMLSYSVLDIARDEGRAFHCEAKDCAPSSEARPSNVGCRVQGFYRKEEVILSRSV